MNRRADEYNPMNSKGQKRNTEALESFSIKIFFSSVLYLIKTSISFDAENTPAKMKKKERHAITFSSDYSSRFFFRNSIYLFLTINIC
jgi:hypothetical protein